MGGIVAGFAGYDTSGDLMVELREMIRYQNRCTLAVYKINRNIHCQCTKGA